MVQPSGSAAIARLASRATVTPGLCLWYVQDAWQTPHQFPHATAQWNATRQHTDMSNIPHGAPVFWTGGRHGYGHIAPYDRNHRGVLSTDQLAYGRVAYVSLSHIGAVWGLNLVGWGSTLGGVALPLTMPAAPVTPPPSGSRPRVSLRFVRVAIQKDGPAKQGYASARANSLPVEKALVALRLLDSRLADGSLGTSTFGPGSAYQRWQVLCNFRGAAADGYPPSVLTGNDSMSRLAAVTKMFTAVA